MKQSTVVSHKKHGYGRHYIRFEKGNIDEVIYCFAGGKNCKRETLSIATDKALRHPMTAFTGNSLFGTRVAVIAYIDDGFIEIHYYDEKSDSFESYIQPTLKNDCEKVVKYGMYAQVAMECAAKYVEENFM